MEQSDAVADSLFGWGTLLEFGGAGAVWFSIWFRASRLAQPTCGYSNPPDLTRLDPTGIRRGIHSGCVRAMDHALGI